MLRFISILCTLYAGVGSQGAPPSTPNDATYTQDPSAPCEAIPPGSVCPWPNAPIITIGCHPITQDMAGAYEFSSKTLKRSSQVIVQGTTYSLGPGGRFIFSNGKAISVTAAVGVSGAIPDFETTIGGDPNGCGDDSSATDDDDGDVTTDAEPETVTDTVGDASATSSATSGPASNIASTTGSVLSVTASTTSGATPAGSSSSIGIRMVKVPSTVLGFGLTLMILASTLIYL